MKIFINLDEMVPKEISLIFTLVLRGGDGSAKLYTYFRKMYLWTCLCKETKPSFNHFERILLNKCQTERYISLKSNNMNSFTKKSRMFEGTFFPKIKSTIMLNYVLYKL